MTDHTPPGAVLVTGGAGFIGCAISQLIAPGADRYIALDNLHPQIHAEPVRPALLHPAAELVVGDVTQPATWNGLLKDFAPDLVIHLAAETGTGQSLAHASRHASVNVVGTTEMLDALVRSDQRPSHVVLSASRAVYGEGAWRRDTGEIFYPGQRTHEQLVAGQWDFTDAISLASEANRTQPNPTSIYGVTKLAQEQLLATWCGAFTVPMTILRLQNVYGPGQSLTNSYTGIVALFSRLARSGQPIPLYEDGKPSRDFVHIGDVARAFAAAATRPPAETVAQFDIGTGHAQTLCELAVEISQFYAAPDPFVTGQFRDGDVRHAACNVEAAGRDLGWYPEIEVSEGLADLQAWIAAMTEEPPHDR